MKSFLISAFTIEKCVSTIHDIVRLKMLLYD